jgi:cyclic pyranopterin phosphate synthase
MPKEVFGKDYVFLKKNEWLRFGELYDLVAAFVQLGVRKIRLTGGEPLLRPGLNKYIHGLKHLHKIEDIALTTNGLRLAERVSELKEAGLDRITVSLDALDPEIAGRMNGLGVKPKSVIAGIDAALDAGFQVKVNMVVQRSVNRGEILPMARYFKDRGVNLRFIEFMDVGNHNDWKMDEVVRGTEILETVGSELDFEPVDVSSSNEVAKRYRYLDGSAEFGLITSVTQAFCGSCTRARISADGQLYTCLFASKGIDLKSILRAPDYRAGNLLDTLAGFWGQREDRYSELRSETGSTGEKVEMSYIGG